jgi:hypothetical protein
MPQATGRAVSAWEDLLPLIHFENRQCGLRAQKICWPRAASSPDRRARRLAWCLPGPAGAWIELAAARDLAVMPMAEAGGTGNPVTASQWRAAKRFAQVLDRNVFVERILPASVLRPLSPEEM